MGTVGAGQSRIQQPCRATTAARIQQSRHATAAARIQQTHHTAAAARIQQSRYAAATATRIQRPERSQQPAALIWCNRRDA
jgi:hypothetical protein